MEPIMRKRLLLWACVLGILACAGVSGVRWLTARRHNVTPASVREITNGMTLKEIEAVMGVPPGDHGRGQVTEVRMQREYSEAAANPTIAKVWQGDEVKFAVNRIRYWREFAPG
jgi:hypothetical protein